MCVAGTCPGVHPPAIDPAKKGGNAGHFSLVIPAISCTTCTFGPSALSQTSAKWDQLQPLPFSKSSLLAVSNTRSVLLCHFSQALVSEFASLERPFWLYPFVLLP